MELFIIAIFTEVLLPLLAPSIVCLWIRRRRQIASANSIAPASGMTVHALMSAIASAIIGFQLFINLVKTNSRASTSISNAELGAALFLILPYLFAFLGLVIALIVTAPKTPRNTGNTGNIRNIVVMGIVLIIFIYILNRLVVG